MEKPSDIWINLLIGLLSIVIISYGIIILYEYYGPKEEIQVVYLVEQKDPEPEKIQYKYNINTTQIPQKKD